MALRFPDGKGPHMIVDDGGDASLLVHMGYRAENDAETINRKGGNHEEQVILDTLNRILAEDNTRWHRTIAEMKGVSEETTTGVHRLYQMMEKANCWFRLSMSTTPLRNRNSTTCTVAVNHWPTVSSALPT